MSLDVHISEPEEFNCIQLHSCIKEVAKIKGISDFEYHVDYIYGKGDNFIANIFRVLVNETGKEDSDISVIVKTLINTTRQELFHELHKREVKVYREVIPKYKLIQNNNEEKLVLPECLYSETGKGNEIIILEDLLMNGFEMDDKLVKYETLTYNQTNLILTELAKFHGLSFVFERKYAKDFQDLKTKFSDIIFQDSFLDKSKLRNYFSDSFNLALCQVTDENAKNKLELVESYLLQVLKNYVSPRKYSVLCHGDCWINNILFKSEENIKDQLCFVDFQAMRYASPVTDIMYFMYVCTDSSFRSEYFNSLQNAYYESLRTFLNSYDIDVNDVYPRQEFDDDIEYYLPYGLIIALIELKLVTTTPQDEAILCGGDIVPGLEKTEVPGEVNLFKIKINDVVKEAIENGSLNRLMDVTRELECL